jgi:hypothetical protein
MPELCFRDRIALGILATAAILTLHAPSCDPMPAGYVVEEGCAREVGVSWSVEEGATEELDRFGECVDAGRLP